MGGGLRVGFPVTEFMNFGGRYTLSQDKVTLNKDSFYSDPDGSGPLGLQCDPLKAGRYLCDEIGGRITSQLGYSMVFDDTDGIRPTRGLRATLSQDLAGLGGDVKYLRSRIDTTKYQRLGGGFILSVHGEGGYIQPGQKPLREGQDAIRLTDRFFGPQLRGFDIRGIGPRVQRIPYNLAGEVSEENATVSDALGGRA